ncbi:Ig-like domain-containing protein [Algoriphagus sp. PAP.12]|uniref:Ig-like domain-containing protein n=1 Tax=Algoriphagus sp. PAP.12 TaxID=2996678 RepID=UPI00227D60B8|nr:Ig-like domain-containing protein [Algoriphagus sp. PAP.12]
MKKTFISSFLGLAISGLLLASCSQMASYENEDLALEQARADKAGFTLSPYGTNNENLRTYEDLSWETECITDQNDTWFEKILTGSAPALGEVSATIYNTPTHLVYEFSGQNLELVKLVDNNGAVVTNPYSVELPAGWKAGDEMIQVFYLAKQATGGQSNPSGNSTTISTSYNLVGICTETTISDEPEGPICTDEVFSITASVSSYGDFSGGMIQIWDASDAIVASADVTDLVNSVTYDFSSGTAGTYSFSAHYVGDGSNGYNDSKSDPINVEVIECGDCDEESFSYDANVVGTDLVNIVFTYDAETALENAEVKFTFPQIQNLSVGETYSAPDGKSYLVNNSGNNTVFTWIGDIGCTDLTAVTFEFEVMAECNASGKAEIWTSASVNGIGVKNEETPNIRFFCTTQKIEESDED